MSPYDELHGPSAPSTKDAETSRSPRQRTFGVLAAILVLALTPRAAVQEDEQGEPPQAVPDSLCLLCHDDALTETTHPEGRLHADVACVDCHVALRAFDLEEMEHDEDVAPASCVECHADETHRAETSAHAENDVGCATCHGTHDIRPVHAADAAVAAGRVNRLCATCHGDVLGSGASEIHALALAGRTCLACHDPHVAQAPTPLVSDESCLSCHEEDHDADPWIGAPLATAGSVHGEAGIGCVLCHAGLQDLERFPHGPEPERVDCGRCHADAEEAWHHGVHGGDPGNGNPAATCADCHGAHAVQPIADPRSSVFPLNLPDTCERCHRPEPPAGHPAPGGERVAAYETSVHGLALRKDGLIVTATCASCHGSHEIRPADDPEASTARGQVPTTCGACHVGILNGYLQGAHGGAFLAGGQDVPVCTDCHEEHGIAPPDAEGSSVSSRHVAATCARCHADDELAQTYGFPRTSLLSWGRSYHGIASLLGEKGAANCASCHGFHEILPSSDPRSPIHPANLEQTCGGCHPSWGAAFTQVPVHSVIDRETNATAWWLRTIYLVLITVTIGVFLLFILVDLLGRLRLRLGIGPRDADPVAELAPGLAADEDRLIGEHETFQRLSKQARIQHGILVTSFVLLVLTGLPVFLSQLPVMRAVFDFEGAYRLRGNLHRAGAVGLIGLSIWHIVGTLLHPGGRRWLWSMMIRPRDVLDLIHEFLFNLGIAKRRPRFGRYGLVEKLEYGAVVWGNLVMIATGFALWRPDWFFGWAPPWMFDVCRVIHGYEATLAFLAIIVWHMYHVHLRPEVFPMNRAWLDGRISREEMRHHHPREYVALLEKRRAAAKESES